jgi:hypothetical protein
MGQAARAAGLGTMKRGTSERLIATGTPQTTGTTTTASGVSDDFHAMAEYGASKDIRAPWKIRTACSRLVSFVSPGKYRKAQASVSLRNLGLGKFY